MAKTNITEFSNVASNNTDINNVNIDENCPASNLNNALRELMKALKDVDTGSQALTALSVTGTLTANGGAVFNEASADVDFRVESNGNANMLFVDGGNDRIGISSSSPVAKLDVNSGDIAISSTQASDNGDLGEFQFWNLTNAGSGSGTSFVNDVASIQGQMEGTGNNSGGSLHFYTKTDGGAKTEQITITGAGNVGIGGAPTANLHVYRATGDASLIIETGQDSGSVEPTLYLISYATNANPAIRFGDRVGNNGFIEYENSDDSLRFGANVAERMRILSGGQILCNTTASLGNGTLHVDAGSNIYCLVARANGTNGALILFQKDDGSTIGQIDHTASATRYLTSSDYRLKENIVTEWDATTRLKQLKPSRFNFIADADTTVDGFLAHEVSSIVPEAISGTKDAVDADGNAVMQGIDQSKLVPLLVKTIQELEARITTLEGA